MTGGFTGGTEQGAAADRQARVRMELLRGLAIAGVAAVHTAGHFAQAGGYSPVVAASLWMNALAHYAVPLFILLSGLALTLRYPAITSAAELRSFLGRRLLRVVPPYVVFSLLYLGLFALEYEPSPPSWILFALLTGNAYYHLWFVALLIQLYVLFPVFLKLLPADATARRTMVVLLLALAAQVLWNTLTPFARERLPERPLIETLLSERIFLSHAFYFLLGIIAGRNLPRFESLIRRPSLVLLLLLSATLTALIGATWAGTVRDYGSLSDAPATALLVATAIDPLLHLSTIALLWRSALTLARANNPPVRALAQLGALAFPIYLIHVFVQWVIARGLAWASIAPSQWGFYPLMFLASLMVSAVLAWLAGLLPFSEFLVGASSRPGRPGRK